MSAPFSALLIANRGEIAIRIARACADLGVRSVAVYAEDDAASLHTRKADVAVALRGRGVPAYLDIDQLIAIAVEQQCTAIHPGYGFLAESAEFARRCAASGLCFIGPSPEVLELFGDKAAARALAERCGVPLVRGLNQAVSLEQAQAFMHELGDGAAVMLKALAGGGGRGMRAVYQDSELAEAYARCQSEALAAFGNGALYVEQLVRSARHIEVQILGDCDGQLSHLHERDCSLQRRNQKLVEIAPVPTCRKACAMPCSTLLWNWPVPHAIRVLVPSSSCLIRMRPGASTSWRPTRAFRSSTPSPKRLPVSTCCTRNCTSAPAAHWPNWA